MFFDTLSIMKHYIFILFFSLFISTAAVAEKEWKLGFIAPLSGPAASFGEPARKGFEFGMKDLKQAHFKVSFEDDQYQPAKAVASTQKFLELEKVDAILSMGSTSCNAVAPMLREASVPLIAWGADPKISKGRPLVIRIYVSGLKIGRAIGDEARRLKYNNVGVLVSTNDYAYAVRNGFLEKLGSDELKFKEEATTDTTDFKTLLLKAKQKGVKQLFLCGLAGFPGRVARQIQELQLKFEIFGCSGIGVPEEVTLAQGALNGAWLYSPTIDPAFVKRYRTTFSVHGDIYPAAHFYELAKLFDEVFSKAQDKNNIIPLLLKTGRRSGALLGYEFKQEGDDQFMDMDLEKYIIGGGVY